MEEQLAPTPNPTPIARASDVFLPQAGKSIVNPPPGDGICLVTAAHGFRYGVSLGQQLSWVLG
jgi:hypothetical protein